MKPGDLVRDIDIHPIRNPHGDRVGIIKEPIGRGTLSSRYEVAWTDGGPDRFVNKRDLEIVNEGR
jgi:hypothetical protein